MRSTYLSYDYEMTTVIVVVIVMVILNVSVFRRGVQVFWLRALSCEGLLRNWVFLSNRSPIEEGEQGKPNDVPANRAGLILKPHYHSGLSAYMSGASKGGMKVGGVIPK